MFARVSVYEIPVDRMDDAVEKFKAALDQISVLDGFSEGFFFVAPEEGRANTRGAAVWRASARHCMQPLR